MTNEPTDTGIVVLMRDGYNGPYQFHDDKAVEAAITAARARLGEKT